MTHSGAQRKKVSEVGKGRFDGSILKIEHWDPSPIFLDWTEQYQERRDSPTCDHEEQPSVERASPLARSITKTKRLSRLK